MRSLLHALLFLLILIPVAASAQWQFDGAPISFSPNGQFSPMIVSDGAGGAIIVWEDYRFGSSDIYAQRVNALGVAQWTPDGVAVCAATNYQTGPVITSDGAGGAIIAWEDLRSGTARDVYVQRVNAAGSPQWTLDGVALSTAANDQRTPKIVSDGAGGAVVAWIDWRSGFDYDIYARRVSAAGAPQWTANGVALCTAFNDQLSVVLASDGAGGAIAGWTDYRTGTADIYARRVNASGTAQWVADGINVCTSTGDQQNPAIAQDGAAGAYLVWGDQRAGQADIYMQRVNGSGLTLWPINGNAVSTASNVQDRPAIIPDGTGGAIACWEDFRSGSADDVYAQRMNAAGAPQWTGNGAPVATATWGQYTPKIVSDGAGGAIIVWQDDRNNFISDIYAQRLNAYGLPQWTFDGVPVCTAADYQYEPVIASDGAGGAIATWYDYRTGFYNGHVFAQRVESRFGYWGHPEPVITSVADIRNDQGGKVAVNWSPSGRDLPVPRAINHYSVWRAVDAVPASAVALGAPVLDDISDVALDAVGPVYASLSEAPGYYWELVGTQSAYGWPGYSFSASTRADSVAGNTGTENFMVAAHDQYDDYVSFASNAMSGHSVDNLAPATPLFLTAQRVGIDVRLKWNSVRIVDLRDYSVYRATASGVTPVPLNFLASAGDTLLVDAGAPSTALYYIVTAYDVHANQSPPSNEATVSPLTGARGTPPITALAVLDNVPNPFGSTTTLRVGLPGESDVAIDVYDVAGRRVRSQHTPPLAAGWREIQFDGRDAAGDLLPSGVYFYRVHAGGQTTTRKMVVMR